MNPNPQIYHGEWWVPAKVNQTVRGFCLNTEPSEGLVTKYKGELTYYEDEDTTLELHHYPSNFSAHLFHQNDVMWGADANGHIFTLFNATITQRTGIDFSTTKFVVGLVLIGAHVFSGDEARFSKCVVQFPYLRNWAFQNMIKGPDINLNSLLYPSILLETQCEENLCWRLRQYQEIERAHDLTITQTTEFEIEATEPQSIKSYLKQIEAFSQFLSIALYCKQRPTETKFTITRSKKDYYLLVKREKSINPNFLSLIKFDLLKDKLPSMLKTWHENFERVAPITSYLIQSLQKKNRFEVPDFLILAQSLDGYFKRFENKKDGKDHRKYEDGIKILLKNFSDVKCVQECHIDPIVLKDSRNFYSHLSPDEEKDSAVDSEDLYWLTEKCKVLLTCCILNMIGMTNEDINLCCENFPIQDIINSLPPE